MVSPARFLEEAETLCGVNPRIVEGCIGRPIRHSPSYGEVSASTAPRNSESINPFGGNHRSENVIWISVA
jgi:hypothetical protein